MSALKVWNGTEWVYVGRNPNIAAVQATAPGSPSPGQLWYDTTVGLLKVYDGTSWELARGADTFLPALSAYKTSAQTLTSGVSAIITMNALRGQSGGMSLSSGMAEIPKDGWYQINVGVAFAASTASARRIVGVASGTSTSSWGALTGAILASAQDTSNITALTSSGAFNLTAGTLVGPWANAGANWGIEVSTTYMCHLSVAYLGEDGIAL